MASIGLLSASAESAQCSLRTCTITPPVGCEISKHHFNALAQALANARPSRQIGGAMILKGLLAAAIFSTVMASQPQIVQIKSSTPDLGKTGVHLVSLDDIGYTATVQAIIGEDRTMVEPFSPMGCWSLMARPKI